MIQRYLVEQDIPELGASAGSILIVDPGASPYPVRVVSLHGVSSLQTVLGRLDRLKLLETAPGDPSCPRAVAQHDGRPTRPPPPLRLVE